jgi:beta-N-acetylhexosaminidase
MDTPGRPISRRGAILSGVSLVSAGFGIGGKPGRAAPPARRAGLTPQQFAGQRVISSYSGLTPPSSLLQQISAGETSGVIFITGNISSDSQIASVVAQLVQANRQSPVNAPLLLMTDQEGGEVRRLPGEPLLAEKQIGASSNPAAAASQAGQGAARNLAGVGMNTDLAPVLDVYRKAGDFDDQYQRSYSKNATTCAQCGQAFITAMQQAGVAATAKHFPGLGAATSSQDTDTGPVTLNVSLSSLRNVDEYPYKSAIAAGVKLVMASWAVYPALDPKLPAGLSPAIIGGELRGRLGFGGVTITDALEAGALKAYGTSAQRGVLAAGAGMDLLLCASGDPAQGQDVATGLAAALQSGQLSQSACTASVDRITALRTSL